MVKRKATSPEVAIAEYNLTKMTKEKQVIKQYEEVM